VLFCSSCVCRLLRTVSTKLIFGLNFAWHRDRCVAHVNSPHSSWRQSQIPNFKFRKHTGGRKQRPCYVFVVCALFNGRIKPKPRHLVCERQLNSLWPAMVSVMGEGITVLCCQGRWSLYPQSRENGLRTFCGFAYTLQCLQFTELYWLSGVPRGVLTKSNRIANWAENV